MNNFLNLTSTTKQIVTKTKKRPISYSTTDFVKSIKSFFSTSHVATFKPTITAPSVPNTSKPFWWINSLSEIYSSLPLPINQHSYSSISLNRLRSNNWFVVPSTYDPTFIPLNNVSSIIFQKVQEFLQPLEVPKKKVKKGRAKKKTEFKTYKIRLFPTKNQKEILNLWFKANRLVYNECVNYYRENGSHKIYENMGFLYKRFIKANCFNDNVMDAYKKLWIFEENIPAKIKQSACDDFIKALDINIAKKTKFKMKFKSRKDASNSILLQKVDYIGQGLIFPTILCDKVEGEWKYLTPLVGSEPLPEKLDNATRLQRTRRGLYYLLVLKPIEFIKIDLPKNDFSNIISLDPGVRTFMTCYDPNQSKLFNWGQSDISKIYNLCYIQDHLQHKMDSLPQKMYHRARKRFVIRKRWYKNFERIHNLIDQLHKNLCKWLVENYSTILLPKFETSNMVKKSTRNINSKTARSMMTWSHYRFKQRLISKAREYPHVNVLIVDEPYTSKTCGNCGSIHHKLGGNKTFHCPTCNITIDRDANGARNILLKFLSTDYHASQEDAAVLGLDSKKFNF